MPEVASITDIRSIALVGNPNSGKSSLFNHLTGLNQQVGNYPGVTVDKKTGSMRLPNDSEVEVTDLPGTYSLHPQSLDEAIVLRELLHPTKLPPDLIIYTADAENLARNMLLFTQIRDLGYSMVLALTMPDRVKKAGRTIDKEALSQKLDCPVFVFNGMTGEGLEEIKDYLTFPKGPQQSLDAFQPGKEATEFIAEAKEILGTESDYRTWVHMINPVEFLELEEEKAKQLTALKQQFSDQIPVWRRRDTQNRYMILNRLVRSVTSGPDELSFPKWDKFDRFITHPVFGYLTFLAILFIVFQAIFTIAAYPMDWIDAAFSWASGAVSQNLPDGIITNLISEGVIPGLGGVVIFIPQIAILFFFIKLMEETGYMSRVVFLMDRLMRPFGLNGKSVVPLMSGVACAIPAIMATRNIENWRERMITIMVTPFMTCSARLPVYTILIALMVPAHLTWGPFGVQGLLLLGMYLLGLIAALASALILRIFIKADTAGSFLVLEMPVFRKPNWRNVLYAIVEKTKTFVFNAGKIIFGISIVLWVLASYSPQPEKVESGVLSLQEEYSELPAEELQYKIQSYKLEQSFAGRIGHFIEPVIAPLGYDWKIGIALVTSFAAREVFVGTLATIYSVGQDETNEKSLLEKMRGEKNPKTGGPRYSIPTLVSLLFFYAFAMQCMSTIAIVKRETKTWKWPLIQLIFMTGLAYLSAFAAYQIVSVIS
jgi:ferrous iron transport protein B